MEAKELRQDELTEVKLSIVQEQEQLAELGRSGEKTKARTVRDRLFRLLYRKDQLEDHD
jgi:hypothetical protein